MFKIQSIADVENMMNSLEQFSDSIKYYFDEFNTSINKFNNNDIVQSFYASGPFGREKEQTLISLKVALEKYYNIINNDSGALIPITKTLLTKQKDLLNGSSAEISKVQMDSSNKFAGRMEIKE